MAQVIGETGAQTGLGKMLRGRSAAQYAEHRNMCLVVVLQVPGVGLQVGLAGNLHPVRQVSMILTLPVGQFAQLEHGGGPEQAVHADGFLNQQLTILLIRGVWLFAGVADVVALFVQQPVKSMNEGGRCNGL